MKQKERTLEELKVSIGASMPEGTTDEEIMDMVEGLLEYVELVVKICEGIERDPERKRRFDAYLENRARESPNQ